MSRPGKRILLSAVLAASLFATIGSGQWVEDSIECGQWVSQLLYNREYSVVYGVSNYDRFFSIYCPRNEVIGRILLPNRVAIAYNSTADECYCTYGDLGEETIAVIDGLGGVPMRRYQVPGAWRPLWDSVTNRLYLTTEEDDVAVVDCTNDSVIARIPVGEAPDRMYLNTRRRKLYVLNYYVGSVSIIDLETLRVLATHTVNDATHSGCYAEAADKFYVESTVGVAVIDGYSDQVIGQVPLTIHPPKDLLAIDGGRMVVAACDGLGRDTVYYLDTETDSVVAALPAGGNARRLTWNPRSGLVYCANGSSDNVAVLAGDGSRVVTVLQVGDFPAELEVAPEFGYVYVGHSGGHWVYVIRDTMVGIEEPEVEPLAAEALQPTTMRAAELARMDCRILDITGRDVTERKAALAPGIYFIRRSVDSDRHCRVSKVILQH